MLTYACCARSAFCLFNQRPHIVETEPFKDTFGSKAQRKKPHLDVGSFAELGAVPVRDDIAEGQGKSSLLSRPARERAPTLER